MLRRFYIRQGSLTRGQDLAKKQEQYRTAIKNLREAVKTEETWIRGQIDEGKKLKKQAGLVIAGALNGKERDAWFSQVQEFLNRNPHKETDRLPNSPTITYGVVYRFPQVERAQNELRGIKKNVEDLRRQAQ